MSRLAASLRRKMAGPTIKACREVVVPAIYSYYVNGGNYRGRDPQAQVFISTSNVVRRARLFDDLVTGEQVVRLVAQELARVLSLQLEEPSTESTPGVATLQQYVTVQLAGGDVVSDSPDRQTAATMALHPVAVLGYVLHSYDAVAPGGAQSALLRYRMALKNESGLDVDAMTPTTFGPPPNAPLDVAWDPLRATSAISRNHMPQMAQSLASGMRREGSQSTSTTGGSEGAPRETRPIETKPRQQFVRPSWNIQVTRRTRDGQEVIRQFSHEEGVRELVHHGLNVLRRGEATEFLVNGTAAGLRECLVVDPEGGDESVDDWPTGESRDEWQSLVELAHAYFPDLPFILRWVTLEESLVVGLSEPGCSPGIATVDLGEGRIETADIDDLSYLSWSSESGGPVSWDGGSRTAALGRGWLLLDRWGDLGQHVEVSGGNRTPEDVARFIASQIDEEHATVAAVLELEELNGNPLPDDERRQWFEAIEAFPMGLRLTCTEDVRQALRATLITDRVYAACQQALAGPKQPLGQRFVEALTAAAVDGMPSLVTYGDWIND